MAWKKPPLIVANTIIPRTMDWVWYPYIPSSSATLLFGPGGFGKSHITVDLVARLTSGRPFPNQTEGRPPQKVLMLSAEDEFDVVLVPRLMKMGADLSRVAFPKVPFTLDKAGIAAVEEYMHEFAATVVFIDPIVQYMGGKVDMNKANEVRAFMGELHQLAIRKHTAIVIVGHSRKTREMDTGPDHEKAMGSADFNNAVRSALFVTKGNDGTRIMRHVKSNYAPEGPALGYEFGENGFNWTGEITDDGILAPVRVMKRGMQEKMIKKWFRDGPVRAKKVPDLAREAGLSMSTVNRIKPAMIESFMVHVDGKPEWYWRLKTEGVKTEKGQSDEIPIQGLEDLGDEPRGRVPGEAPKRRSSRRRVDAGAGTGAREPVPSVGRRGSNKRAGGSRSAATEAPAPDPKAIAREFLRELGASR